MNRLVRPLALAALTSGGALAVLHALGGPRAVGVQVASLQQVPMEALGLTSTYDLASLDLLEATLYYVEEGYVEPDRVDWERMYVEALAAVERRVPVSMFRREPGGSLLHVEIGDYRTVLEVDEVRTRGRLAAELRKVSKLLAAHLGPEDVPSNNEASDPLAEVEYAMVNGLLGTLDPHSHLLPPEESKDMDVDNRGEFGGLGITIVDREGRLTVEYPLPDTPAAEAGLLPDDQIVRIDGESTINMPLDEAVSKLRGPVGAPVVIEIMREGLSQPEVVRIVRQAIKINPVQSEVLDDAIGYVSIKSFHAAVEADLHGALAEMTAATGGLRGLVLDLRSNPGGYLTQAVAVADTFLDDGMIVAQVSGNGEREGEARARPRGTQPDYPIVVLVNSSSASASEIVAGALRGHDRAVVVGERTFGKGSVQNLHPFFDDSKLKLTISKYLTPGDQSIQSVGIPADVALTPVVAEWSDAEEPEPLVLVHWRERVRREADLDKHLERSLAELEPPAYSLAYHRRSVDRQRTAELQLDGDFEVAFARELLLASRSPSRAALLAAIQGVVERHAREGEREIEAAMAALGVDWTAGDNPEEPAFELRLDLGEDGRLRAGEEERVAVELTNTGSVPLYRTVVVSSSDNEILDGREFVFGRLEPGETRRFEHRVRVLEGYPSEMTPIELTLRDDRDEPLATRRETIPVEGRELPALSWSWSVSDARGGDGDGVVEVGETLDIDLTVENLGAGPTAEAFARVENKSGRALDILTGTLEVGPMLTPEGGACGVVTPGWENGRAVGDAEEGSGRPEYAEGCLRRLDAGASWTGTFRVEVRHALEEPLALELTLGDAKAYDHATVVRSGFYSYFTASDDILLPVGAGTPSVPRRDLPVIDVSRQPEPLVEDGQVTLSGVVSDDDGVRYVMVFHNDDKVFFEGGGSAEVRRVPFTTTLDLEPGLNTLSILTTDRSGHSSTRSVVTYYADEELQAKLRRD